MAAKRKPVAAGVAFVVRSLFVGVVTPAGEAHSTMRAEPAEGERDAVSVAELPAECRPVVRRLATGHAVSEGADRAWIGGRWSYVDPSWGWASGEGRWLVVARTSVSGGWDLGGPVRSDALHGPGSISVDVQTSDVHRSGSFHRWAWFGTVGVAFAVTAGVLLFLAFYRWLGEVDVYTGP